MRANLSFLRVFFLLFLSLVLSVQHGDGCSERAQEEKAEKVEIVFEHTVAVKNYNKVTRHVSFTWNNSTATSSAVSIPLFRSVRVSYLYLLYRSLLI